MAMKRLIVLLCLFCITHLVNAAITEKQMKATKKLVRNTCVNKSKTPVEHVDAMQKGDFSNGGCYLLCILETYKAIKGNTYDYDSAVAAIKANAPVSMADDAVAAVLACKDSMKTKDDKCKGAAEIGKCIYDFAPEVGIHYTVNHWFFNIPLVLRGLLNASAELLLLIATRSSFIHRNLNGTTHTFVPGVSKAWNGLQGDVFSKARIQYN